MGTTWSAPPRRGSRVAVTSYLLGLVSVVLTLGTASPADAASSSAIAAARQLELKNAGGVNDPNHDLINDWECKASSGSLPVVLIHGTFGFKKAPQDVRAEAWEKMGRALKQEGRCVYALEYGKTTPHIGPVPVGPETPGTGDMNKSAHELRTFVDGVKEAAGAAKVDLVGWSQGGLVARRYLKDTNGASVDHLVGLAPPNHGSNRLDAMFGGLIGFDATPQMRPGSTFIKELNTPAELVAGVAYTMLATHGDDWVKPDSSPFLSGSHSQLTNSWLPNTRGTNGPEHAMLNAAPSAISWVKEGIRTTGKPADPNFKP